MITLACIADGGYVRHAAAMLHSAMAHTTPPVSVHALHVQAMTDEDAVRLEGVVEAGGGRLALHRVDGRDLDLPAGMFQTSVWARIALPDLLPGHTRVLYLDSDVVVTDALEPLWTSELGDSLLGAVTNPLYPFMRPHWRDVLGLPRPEDYFNSGVLLMNLDRMRAESTTDALRAYGRTHPDVLYPDQDALNVVCRDRWLRLHPRWNVQTTLYDLPAARLPMPANEVDEALHDPAVIHFIGPFKPWQYICRHPERWRYFVHAEATPWGVPPLQGRSLTTAVVRQLPVAWVDRWIRLERTTKKWRARARIRTRIRNAMRS